MSEHWLPWDAMQPFRHIWCPFNPNNKKNERQAVRKVIDALPVGAHIIHPPTDLPDVDLKVLSSGVRVAKSYSVLENKFFGRCDLYYRPAHV
jgi:hypothetical protein